MPDRLTSEQEIIACLTALTGGCEGAFALTDDAALLSPPEGHDLVLTTDAVAAGIHYLPDDGPADIAWKALAVNLSDLAGKGASPLGYQMALSFPEAPARSWMEAFAAGLGEVQARFGGRLLGGDTDRRPGPLTVTITMIGTVPRGAFVRRGTARAGDALYVSGHLGEAALGLRLRQGPLPAAEWGLSAEEIRALAQRYTRPEPRLGLGPALRAHASAAMDLSDGLLKDLGRMAAASGVGVQLDLRTLAMQPFVASLLSHRPQLVESIVAGGDDYEILAAVPADHAAEFEQEVRATGVAVSRIGVVDTSGTITIRGLDGEVMEMPRRGWDHF